MIAVATCNSELVELFIQLMMDPDHLTDLSTTHSRYLALALAILYLGRHDYVMTVTFLF